MAQDDVAMKGQTGQDAKLPVMPLFTPRCGLNGPNDLLVFIHVPKCGGTSAHALFRRIFGRRYVNVHQSLIKQGLEPFFASLPDVRGIGGHFGLNRNPALPLLAGRNLRYFTMVREPISRFVSHYRYFTRSPKSMLVQNNPKVAKFSLDDFVNFQAEEQRASDYNIQTRMLTGSRNFDDSARSVLLNHFIGVCPSEFSDTVFETIAANMDRPIAEPIRANESPGEPVQTISKSALEYICAVSIEDVKLYNFAKLWFAQNLASKHIGSTIPPGAVSYFGQGQKLFETIVRDVTQLIAGGGQTLLCELMQKHGSDKRSERHNYTVLYDRIFGARRMSTSAVFEMGLGTSNTALPANMGANGVPGASLRGWRDYFPQAAIHGADIDREILFSMDRVATYFADQRNTASLESMWSQCACPAFDLIVDDGLHRYEAAVNLFRGGFPRLKPGGYYVIEDVWLSEENTAKYETFLRAEKLDAMLIHLPADENLRDNAMIVVRKPDLA